MTEENVAALRRAGCAETWMGVESGAQTVLDAMDKGITLGQVRGAVGRLRAAGIRIGFFLQFGYPGEGWPEIEMTRELVRELAPDDIGISVSYPLPGTRFHERVKARLGEKRNWTESNDLDPCFRACFRRSSTGGCRERCTRNSGHGTRCERCAGWRPRRARSTVSP